MTDLMSQTLALERECNSSKKIIIALYCGGGVLQKAHELCVSTLDVMLTKTLNYICPLFSFLSEGPFLSFEIVR